MDKDLLKSAEDKVKDWREAVRDEEVVKAQQTFDSRLSQGDEEINREIRIKALKDLEENLAGQYDAHLQESGIKRNDKDRRSIVNQQKKVAKELADMEPMPEEQKLPDYISSVSVMGKGGRLVD